MRALPALAAAFALLVPGAGARQQPRALALRPVVSGLAAPVYVTAPPSEPGRLYIVEKAGRILVRERGGLRTFLDIRSLVGSSGIEQGLFSVAFHPGYPRDPRLYVDYTDRNGDTRVVEYRSDGSRALPETPRQLLFVDQPYANHNGGQLQFGPDGYLYVGMGDGGSGGDPENRAQNLSSLLGKLLRIDVDRPGGGPQIVGYGLRNPWRFSFDRSTGDLYIADVGQSAWEEVDYLPRRSPGLENYGWDVYEGRASFEDKAPNPRGRLIWPITVYGHADGDCSITGGYVYHRRYVFGDFCSGRVWSLRVVRGKATDVRREPFDVPALSSFGEDARGRLYAVSLRGTLYRVTGL